MVVSLLTKHHHLHHHLHIFAVCRKSSAELDQLSADTSNNNNNNNNETLVKILPDINIMEHDAGKSQRWRIWATRRFRRPNDHVPIADARKHHGGAIENSFDLNAVAPLMITQALLPNLRAHAAADNDNSKIIIISSLMGSISRVDTMHTVLPRLLST